MRYSVLIAFSLVISIANAATCPKAYSHCNLGKDGFINVHLVSHTHDDVGWLKTVDQYFYGSNSDKQEATVQYVLDGVVEELTKDPNKRFVYVEIAYFWRWWNEQSESTQQQVKTLVDEGRLEFVIGAWCMNDEANPYYTDMIDQQTLGFKFILEEFGPCARPRAAWQIDPFGHSREQASLFAQFGFDGLFLGRIDYQDFDHRGDTKTREMVWQASANLGGNAARLFTGVLPNGYGPPPGFCWDNYCGDDPIMDDPNLDEYNVDNKVNDFIKYTLDQANKYQTKNQIMTMGSDFQYSNAHRWFKNLDKLIHYVNERQVTNGSKVNIFYSTTACYLYSLNRDNVTWPLKTDDFFPYAHRPHSFWTGYFTSRTALKYNIRRVSSYLQSVRHIAALGMLDDESTADSISTLERAMGVAQHHDAVAGTEKQHVANDYAKRLSIGVSKCVKVINDSINTISKINNIQGELDIEYCSLLNITECLAIENKKSFLLVAYNPLPRTIQSWISVPVVDKTYQVTEVATGKVIPIDYAPVYPEINLIIERQSKANYNLVFGAQLAPVGLNLFYIQRPTKVETARIFNKKKSQVNLFKSKDDNIVMDNNHLNLTFDKLGNLIQIVNKDEKLTTGISQLFCIYKSMPGENSQDDKQASGAYIFRPLNNTPDCLSVRTSSYLIANGFVELHQVFNDWISQTIRLYANATNAEFEWQVGPIDIKDNVGREVVMRFDSDVKSNSTFYTDSNGREMLKRIRDFRPTWKLNQTEAVAGNYYPVNSRIYIRDETTGPRQLTLLNDRSQGGSSLFDGSFELMLHRRTLYDDSLGVGEPLNETILDKQGLVVKGKTWLVFSSINASARLHRELAHEINNGPLIVFGLPPKSDNLKKLAQWRGIKLDLPLNLHLLTFAREFPLNKNIQSDVKSLLVRIEHFYELNEDPVLSQPVTINLVDFFNHTFNLVGVDELALGANMDVDELDERLIWNSANYIKKGDISKKSPKYKANDDFSFTFNPMQIRTFRLYFV